MPRSKAATGPFAGATGAVLDRSLEGLRSLVDRALADVCLTAGLQARREVAALDMVLEEVRIATQLDATAPVWHSRCRFDPGLSIATDREMLSSALANLFQNAFKFTQPGGPRFADRGRCRGARAHRDRRSMRRSANELAEELFLPFTQRSDDRSGVGWAFRSAVRRPRNWRDAGGAERARHWLHLRDQSTFELR